MSPDTLLECRDLCVGYEKKAVAHHLSFTLHKGEYLCIVGENGAGKTTLMKTLLGIIPPVSGEYEYQNELKKKGVGYLPQQSAIQKDFPATALEVVLSGFQHRVGFHPFYNRACREEAIENLHKFGADCWKNECFSHLSGGQQQRVLLARALCATKDLLLVDEPVAGLDPLATEDMYRHLQQLHAEGIAIIMITHDVESALTYATHLLLVDNESFFGTKEEFLKADFALLQKGARHHG